MNTVLMRNIPENVVEKREIRYTEGYAYFEPKIVSKFRDEKEERQYSLYKDMSNRKSELFESIQF